MHSYGIGTRHKQFDLKQKSKNAKKAKINKPKLFCFASKIQFFQSKNKIFHTERNEGMQ